MVTVYAVSLALGVLGLLLVILGGAVAENMSREERDPGRAIGLRGRTLIGVLVGFGMAGMSAELSTLGLSWPLSLVLALIGGIAGGLWAGYMTRRESSSDAGPV